MLHLVLDRDVPPVLVLVVQVVAVDRAVDLVGAHQALDVAEWPRALAGESTS